MIEFSIDNELSSIGSLAGIEGYEEFLPPEASSEIGAPFVPAQGHLSGVVQLTQPTFCSSADLLNAVKLHHDVPDRAVLNFLELIKLPEFRPETIRHADIKRHEDVSRTSAIQTVLRCETCLSVLHEQICPEDW